MRLHIVHGHIGGYAREDAPVPTVYGAFTEERHEDARLLSIITGGSVTEVTLNETPAGYAAEIKLLFGHQVKKA